MLNISNEQFLKLASDSTDKPFDKDYWKKDFALATGVASVPIGLINAHVQNEADTSEYIHDLLMENREFVPYTQAGIHETDTPDIKKTKLDNVELRFGNPNGGNYHVLDHPSPNGKPGMGLFEFIPKEEFVKAEMGKIPVRDKVFDALKASPKHIGKAFAMGAMMSIGGEALMHAPTIMGMMRDRIHKNADLVLDELEKRASLDFIINNGKEDNTNE